MKNLFKEFVHTNLLYFILAFSMLFSPCADAQYIFEYLREHPEAGFYEVYNAVEAYYRDKDKGRGSGYVHFMRWAHNVEPYAYPSGEIKNFQARIFSEYKAYQRKLEHLGRETHGKWFEQGPDSYVLGSGWNGGNGRVNRVYFHPSNPSVFYICTPSGGLWRTQNAGVSWTCLTDGMPTLGVSGFAINYNNTNVMYLLTGDGDGNNSPSIGVLKSFDGGNTWVATDLNWAINWDYPTMIRAFNLVMHPTNPEILYVAASNGIWKTSDGGQHWQMKQGGVFFDIEFKPGDPAKMYATSTNYFWKSTNSGDNWVLDGDPDFPTEFCRIEMAVSPDQPNSIYLLFGGHVTGTGNGHFSGVYRSVDEGAEFSLMSDAPNILGLSASGQDSTNQACYDLAIAVDPNNANTIYVGGINVWKSTNGGSSWSIISHWVEDNNTIGYTHADIHDLRFNGSTLYCGSDGGIFRSTDGGANWTNLSSGLAIMQFYKIDVEGNIYSGGTQDNGCNQWTSATSTATHTIGADGFACLIDYTNTNIRYQSDQNNKYRSVNGGMSFTSINVPGISGYWNSDWIMDPVEPERLYVAQRDIWRTTSGGVSGWTDLNAGFTNNKNIESMAQGVSNRNRIYASDRLSIRTCGNVNSSSPDWSDISAGLPFAQAMLSDIVVDPLNAQRIWVSFYGFSNGNKVFYSPNGGTNWYNESGTLPNIPVNCIVYQAGTSDGLYIGTDIGVFYRNDGIGDWIYFPNGMPTVRVMDMDIEGGYLYAGTHGRGLWKSEMYTGCPSSYTLTPFNDPGNENFTGIQRYHAGSSITSSRIITGGIGTDVIYAAGSEITLTSGFHAKRNNLFVAKLEGCPE